MDRLRILFVKPIANMKPPIGSLVGTSSMEVAEALSLCGFEWLFFDPEHSVVDMAAVQRIIQSVSPRTFGVIRLPDNCAEHFKQVLDTGCDGVVVPMIKSLSDGERGVSLAKYFPLGNRSVGAGKNAGLWIELQRLPQEW